MSCKHRGRTCFGGVLTFDAPLTFPMIGDEFRRLLPGIVSLLRVRRMEASVPPFIATSDS
jgi:hypothetical protein